MNTYCPDGWSAMAGLGDEEEAIAVPTPTPASATATMRRTILRFGS
jgi:hypothetical protein